MIDWRFVFFVAVCLTGLAVGAALTVRGLTTPGAQLLEQTAGGMLIGNYGYALWSVWSDR